MTNKMNNNEAIMNLNKIEGFQPSDFLRTLKKEDNTEEFYLDVKYRKLWFRVAHPEGKIKKNIITLNDKMAIIEARVYLNRADDEDSFVGSAIAQRYYDPSTTYGQRYAECAETAAAGRALAEAGFGSQFANADDVPEPTPVDAPLILENGKETKSEQKVKKEVKQEDKEFHKESQQQIVSKEENNNASIKVATTTEEKNNPLTEKAIPVTESMAEEKNEETASHKEQPKQTLLNTAFLEEEYTENEEILETLTLEEAMHMKSCVGISKGRELQTLDENTLRWIATRYRGNQVQMKAAAILLLKSGHYGKKV